MIVLFGGTGTLGHALAKIIEREREPCTVVSRCELRQKEMAKKFPDFNYVLGDVTDDSWSWSTKIHSARYIFNLAASKHVDICESNVQHCKRVNLDGAINVYRWARTKIGSTHVFSSTDKAVLPVNAYGMSKSLAERLFLDERKSSIYRWGNILGSRGSVLPIIKDCIKNDKTFTLTHPDMTRFWAHIDDVAEFMWERKGMISTKEPHIPPMKAASMVRILKIMGCKWEIGEIRPGEKIHEVLRTGHDFCLRSDNCEQYTDDELEALIARCI